MCIYIFLNSICKNYARLQFKYINFSAILTNQVELIHKVLLHFNLIRSKRTRNTDSVDVVTDVPSD